MKFSERLKQLNLDKTEQFLIYLFLSTLLIALILITTKMGIWAVQLEQILFYYFVAWVFLGFVTFAMITKDISKRYDTKKPGKALLYYGFLATLWAVMGSQFLNLSYWGSVSDWVSAVGLIVLTMYLVQETINQRKLQYKPELLAKDRLNLYFHNFNKVIEKYPAINNGFVKDHLGVWSKSYKEPAYYENMISEFLLNVKKNNNVADPFELEKVEINIEDEVYVEVYNIGKGFAKNIEYTWEIEHSKLFENFYKKYENDPLIYKIENGFVHSYYFGGTPDISLASNNKIRIDTYNLVTPYESSKEVLKIPLPWNLLKIIGLCSKKGGFSDLTNFPLKLHLNYQDIEGNPYLKTYEMRAYRIEPGRYSHYPKLLFTDNNDFMAYEFRIYESK
ncbi:hypothetical protein HNP86_001652 [Methanococcus maripaludis]|uniref:Uncharacterized protein n=1 Tax=Methanococcus maripaludis TaxID=39152 RepID=A0A7J9NUY9_METMI|nr:hypothetical protein [Methanococcus maripaludis]MBA2851499.1 hypothetical protein [Methanococcus maripaludis]